MSESERRDDERHEWARVGTSGHEWARVGTSAPSWESIDETSEPRETRAFYFIL